MAKSNEQKFLDLLNNATYSRFDVGVFARMLGESDLHTQKVFADAMLGFIGYKAVYADLYPAQMSNASISALCQHLRDSLADYDWSGVTEPNKSLY